MGEPSCCSNAAFLEKSLNEDMISLLKIAGYVQSPKVEQALRHAPRGFFVPNVPRVGAYQDRALDVDGILASLIE